MPACRRLAFLCVAIVLLPTMPVAAIEQIQLKLGALQGNGWSARDVVIDLRLGEHNRGQLALVVKESQWPAPLGRIRAARISCTELLVDATTIECFAGVLRASSPFLEDIQGRLKFRYRIKDGSFRFTVADLKLSGGTVSLQGNSTTAGWEFSLNGKELQLELLLKLAKTLGYEAGYQASGALDLNLQTSGNGSAVAQVNVSGSLSGVDFNNAAGTHAGEQLHVSVTAQLRPVGDGWNVETKLIGKQGQIYIDPIFLEIPDQPLELSLAVLWPLGPGAVKIESLHWRHPGVVDATGKLQLELKPEPVVTDLDVDLREIDLAGFYSTYVKPWLLGTMGGDMDVQGSLHGRVRYGRKSLQSLELRLESVSVMDQLGRVEVEGLQGTVDWAADREQRYSTLSWERAGLFRMAIGAAQVPVVSTGFNFALAQPVRLPMLDGELRIEKWQVKHAGLPEMRWEFDGLLTPISMQAFTAAMGWPTLAGKLSGLIPQVSYEHGLLKVGGVLLVRAFDGTITVRNLELAQPFGIVPRLQADIEIDKLDLKTLTRTFSFGRIEGRLSGHVKGLRLEQWRPVAFMAELKTPPKDKSRHRISQRALENISDIGGGGVGGLLSRSFLGFFEDFPYHQLGISCRLQNGVCQMAGAAPTGTAGYYIVQGRLLPPRVNVIGYADQVDWNTLVEQLITVTTGEASPTVQ
ncbi:MAG: hypothetical protein V3S33_06620 [Gammaproteobacteria bacterium]